MDHIDFPSFLDSAGKEIQARLERARHYRHPSGTGDAREDAIRDYLREVLPEKFAVDRGKLFDSKGLLSKEFDVIVSERLDVAPAMALAGRRVIPVETVYGVLEVKSYLNETTFWAFIDAVVELDQMTRYYRPVRPLLNPDVERELAKGRPVQDDLVGRLWSGVIALETPGDETLCRYVSRHCDGFLFICVPGDQLVVKWAADEGFRGIPYGLKSLPLAVHMIMTLVSGSSRSALLAPDMLKYRTKMIDDIGDIPNGWAATPGGASK